MAASPSSFGQSWLYRTARRAVICAGLALILAGLLLAQSSGRAKKPTGPRALGLIEITPNGKVSLLPVVVMIDGEFYDASAYKAAPVPFALYTDTVYEGVKTGVSQGLFTVTGAQRGETTWRGEGNWKSAEEIAAAEAKKKAAVAREEKAKTIQDNADGPPVLHRRGEESQAPAASAPATTTSSSSSSEEADGPDAPPTLKRPSSGQSEPPAAGAPTATSGASAPASTSASAAAAQTPSAAAPPAAPPQASAPPANDPNLPTLRRGKAAAAKEEAREAAAAPAESPITKAPGAVASVKPAAVATSASATSSGIQYFPAISDANGPEPRPYAYNMKPEEEAKFRDKMLALAAIEVRARAKDLAPATVATTTASRPSPAAAPAHASLHKAAKAADPSFSDVQFRVFDLSNNNEPVLVLTANAHMPQAAKGPAAADIQYVVTLVAREDIYGDLHKAFSNVTDTQHLDVLPRLELIDAVDADGDGRGELLFRQVSDSGKAFVLYRVIGDQLWPLFQGKIG